MAVAFNRETARILGRMSEQFRRQPQNRVPRTKHQELENFYTIVCKAPTGGITGPGSGVCEVQDVDADGGVTNAGWTETVVNIFSTAITADAVIIASKDNTSGRWIVQSEDCP